MPHEPYTYCTLACKRAVLFTLSCSVSGVSCEFLSVGLGMGFAGGDLLTSSLDVKDFHASFFCGMPVSDCCQEVKHN